VQDSTHLDMDTAFNSIKCVSDKCEFLEHVFDLLLFKLACIEIALIEIWLCQDYYPETATKHTSL
jgi:hypothetical protein